MQATELFYVQAADGSVMAVPFGTAFGLAETETGHHVVAQVSDELRITLYAGSEAECRAYLSHLPAMLSRAGVPVAFTQGDPRRPPADPDDANRWGKQ